MLHFTSHSAVFAVTFFVDTGCRKADIYARAGTGSFGTFTTSDA
jgi:hypothetical protein